MPSLLLQFPTCPQRADPLWGWLLSVRIFLHLIYKHSMFSPSLFVSSPAFFFPALSQILWPLLTSAAPLYIAIRLYFFGTHAHLQHRMTDLRGKTNRFQSSVHYIYLLHIWVVSGFCWLATSPYADCLVCSFCSLNQPFAYSFFQIPPRDGHPCCSANASYY